ncbi:MAG: hypothetical protein JRI76_13210 [Deltaproteobacteria bacterium]|nr:hypothetical protein [Deltaproteobacteria bacterium]MBW2042965.1 hypothetical protein [Deltaproteobacteria bacterium]
MREQRRQAVAFFWMETELKRVYFFLLIPALLGLLAAYLARSYLEIEAWALTSTRPVAVLLFVLAFAFGVALPILFRTLFVHRKRREKQITRSDLLKFERGTLYIALVAPYITLMAYFIGIPRFHFTGIVLACFYAIYYFYPSKKRIQYEKRVFRVR